MSIALSPATNDARIGPHASGARMSLAEFRRLGPSECEEGYRYELIGGVLIVSPPPLMSERDPNEVLGFLLRMYRHSNPLGKSLDHTIFEQDIETLPDTMRRADRAIWAGLGRKPDLERDVPSILVEFVSKGRRNLMRDYETKRDEYLAIGVQEYWVFDRFQRQMTVFRPKKRAKVVKEGQSYTTVLLPGFVLPLNDLLKRADDWA